MYRGVDRLLQVKETRSVKLKDCFMVCSPEGRRPWAEIRKAGQATQDYVRFSGGDSASDGAYTFGSVRGCKQRRAAASFQTRENEGFRLCVHADVPVAFTRSNFKERQCRGE